MATTQESRKQGKQDKQPKAKKDKSAKAKKNVTTTDIADELGIDSKALRVFLRSDGNGVGRGKRYRFTEKQAAKLIQKYQKANGAGPDEDVDDE